VRSLIAFIDERPLLAMALGLIVCFVLETIKGVLQ